MQYLKRKWADLLLVIVLAVCIGLVFLDAKSYPVVPWTSGGPPDFYPKLLATLLGLFAVGILFEKTVQELKPSRAALIRVVIILILLIATFNLIGVLGFRLTAVGLSLGSALTLYNWKDVQPRSLIVLVIASIAIPLLLAYGFEDFAGRRLPRLQL